MKKTLRFGIIGGGLMGKEFASAAARWCHLTGDLPTPEIVGVCSLLQQDLDWFSSHFSTVKYLTKDYQDLLEKKEIDVIYCAVPHHLHQKIYCDIIRSGKHMLGEKPFGIDKAANDEILKACAENPKVLVRCASEFPYFPACQQLIRFAREGRFGKLIEVRSYFRHSSDMDPQKPINWKRQIEFNGEYGCMGDLGIHTQHVPFRLGWKPQNVSAKLSKIIRERPDGKGGTAPCLTWDNAVLTCDALGGEGEAFPLILDTRRLSPGSTNEWGIEVYGLNCSARFCTNDPGAFCYTQQWGKEQAWCRLDMGYKTLFPTITGGIFEFGFTDAILQMWAAFVAELDGRKVEFGCFTPEETALSHAVHTAALQSQKEQRIITL